MNLVQLLSFFTRYTGSNLQTFYLLEMLSEYELILLLYFISKAKDVDENPFYTNIIHTVNENITYNIICVDKSPTTHLFNSIEKISSSSSRRFNKIEDGKITLYGLELGLKPIDLSEKLMVHNFSSLQLRVFARQINTFLPIFLRKEKLSLTTIQNYFEYKKRKLHNNDINVLSGYVLSIPKNVTSPPIHKIDKYHKQYAFNGERVVYVYSKYEQRLFDQYGDRLRNQRTFKLNTNIRFTVEGILLPKIKNQIYGWECMPYNESVVLIILDVFVYKESIIIDKPYKDRREYIPKICALLPKQFLPETPIKVNNEQLKYTNGFVYRSLEGDEILKVKHSYNYVLNTQTLKQTKIDGDVSFKNIYWQIYSLNYALHMEVVIVYSYSKQYYYCCKFNKKSMVFEHCGLIERTKFDQDKPISRFYKEDLNILNPQSEMRGIFYLRVYFSTPNKHIGYSIKDTTGKHDLPKQSVLFPHNNATIIKNQISTN